MRTDSPLTTQSVRYHSLSGTISFRLHKSFVSAASQARLHGVLGHTSMHETFLEAMPSVLFGRSDVNRNRGILQTLQAAGFASDPGNNCVTRTGSNIFLPLSEAPLYTDIFPVFHVNKLKYFTYINTHM
jgi:hypothetical protein